MFHQTAGHHSLTKSVHKINLHSQAVEEALVLPEGEDIHPGRGKGSPRRAVSLCKGPGVGNSHGGRRLHGGSGGAWLGNLTLQDRWLRMGLWACIPVFASPSHCVICVILPLPGPQFPYLEKEVAAHGAHQALMWFVGWWHCIDGSANLSPEKRGS